MCIKTLAEAIKFEGSYIEGFSMQHGETIVVINKDSCVRGTIHDDEPQVYLPYQEEYMEVWEAACDIADALINNYRDERRARA